MSPMNPLKIAAIAGVSLISLSVAYSLVIVLPASERRRLDLQERELSLKREELTRLATEKAEATALARAAVKKDTALARADVDHRRTLRESKAHDQQACLENVDLQYHENWAQGCKNEIEYVREQIRNCDSAFIPSPDTWEFVERCKAKWVIPNGEPNCKLRGNIADRLGKLRREMRDECLRRYPTS